MKLGWQAVVVQAVQVQQPLLHDSNHQQQRLQERPLASEERWLALIEHRQCVRELDAQSVADTGDDAGQVDFVRRGVPR